MWSLMWRMTWHNKSVVTIHATLKLIHIYIYIYIQIMKYIYIYIYIERERERDYDTTYNSAKKIWKAF